MKQSRLTILLFMLTNMICNHMYAYDFYSIYNGVTIYYNRINNNTELEVTYKECDRSNQPIKYLGYENINSITIPQVVTHGSQQYNVTSIGDYAFYGCTSLATIDIPNSVTSIGGSAFSACSGLTSIDIPSGVTSIGQRAFYGCSSLTSIDIPNSVTTIGNYAFGNCSSLTSIDIGNSVTSIGEGAFRGCSGLTSIDIPDSVTSIGNGAFSGCTGLTSIKVNSANPQYDSRNNCNAIIEKATNALIFGCKNTIIPNSVKSIGESAFDGCSSLTSITIPSCVTGIGQRAFYGCSSLTSIDIPNSVTTIGNYAFGNCSSLTSVTINSNAIISKTYSSSLSLKNIFGNQVKSYIIGDSVTSIGSYAFYNCSSLNSVTIPSSVTSIGSNAFSSCTNLQKVLVPINDYAAFCNNNIMYLIQYLVIISFNRLKINELL